MTTVFVTRTIPSAPPSKRARDTNDTTTDGKTNRRRCLAHIRLADGAALDEVERAVRERREQLLASDGGGERTPLCFEKGSIAAWRSRDGTMRVGKIKRVCPQNIVVVDLEGHEWRVARNLFVKIVSLADYEEGAAVA